MRFPFISLVVLALASCALAAAPKGQAPYLDGLDSLENGKWAEAAASFAKAIEEDEENPNYYIARGVARTFAEDFMPAMADFDRALRLDMASKHAKLWKSALTSMQGNFMASSMIYPAATHDQYENQVQDLARLYGEYNFRRNKGENEPIWMKKWEADHLAAKKKFVEIARLFSARVKGSTGDIVPLLVDRAVKKIGAKDFTGAMKDLREAAAAKPNDLGIFFYRAVCNLNLGSPSAAREQFMRVLTYQPNNAEAWNGHGLASAALGDVHRGKASVENAVSLNPQRAQAYRDGLAAQLKFFLGASGDVKAMAAMDLRSTRSWEDALYIYYRYPLQAELRQAEEYDRQAKALWALAERHLEAAAKNYAGKALGHYYSGVLAKRRGQAQEARAAFERCVAMAPDHAAAWDQLTQLYHAMGMKLEAAMARSAVSNLVHTTSGHLLGHVWGQIVRTANKSAAETLTKSMSVDPADPRNYAYMAVIAASREDKAASLAWWRCAAALEEAHAQLNGVSFRSQPHEALSSAVAGRVMAINLRLGKLALEQDQAEAAAGAFAVNLGIGRRFARMDRFAPLATSQFPDKQTDLTVIPEADTALSLMAWSHLGMGEALMKQKREQEAMAQFNAVRVLPKEVPPTINPGNMLADPAVLATINMLKPLIERKDYQKAQQVARSHGHSGMVTKEYGDELRRLTKEIEEKLAQGRYDEHDRQVEEARRKQQEEVDKFLKERAERDRQRRQRRPPGR